MNKKDRKLEKFSDSRPQYMCQKLVKAPLYDKVTVSWNISNYPEPGKCENLVAV